jgi:hypothetical protein
MRTHPGRTAAHTHGLSTSKHSNPLFRPRSSSTVCVLHAGVCMHNSAVLFRPAVMLEQALHSSIFLTYCCLCCLCCLHTRNRVFYLPLSSGCFLQKVCFLPFSFYKPVQKMHLFVVLTWSAEKRDGLAVLTLAALDPTGSPTAPFAGGGVGMQHKTR